MAARSLASGSKRLDLCAAQIAELLHLSETRSLEGKVCLELGSGWVLSHALVMYLLGAARVIATDVEPVAQFPAVRRAIRTSSESIVRDVLAPFSSHAAVRARLTNLRSIRTFDRESLQSLGIEYRAPIDLARVQLDWSIDFAYSISVLEHVPVEDLLPLLRNVAGALRPGGFMLHAIHLEDHLDFADPFAFLGARSGPFDRDQQTSRGNRLRASQVMQLFDAIPGLSASAIYAWQRTDRALPGSLDPAIHFNDEDDLRTSHLGVLASR